MSTRTVAIKIDQQEDLDAPIQFRMTLRILMLSLQDKVVQSSPKFITGQIGP